MDRHKERKKKMKVIGMVADIAIIIPEIELIAVIVRRWKT